MEQSEVEVLVGELETRMERLRALYEMYFMGIEKLEPLVPKKDVERRMQALRKEQIRNTGLRFKFQTVIQRFNTYQTYWLRIARQIEQGTYAPDVKRAAARFGVDPMKERVQPPTEQAAESEKPKAKVIEIPEELAPESGDASLLEPLDEENDPFAQIATPPPPPAPSAPRVQGTPPRERFASAHRFELDELAPPFEESDPFPKPAGSPSGPKLRIAPRPGATKMPPPPPEERRDTERRIPVVTSFAPSPVLDPADQGPGSVPNVASRANEPRVIIAKRPSITDEAERAPSMRPAATRIPPRVPGATLQRPGTLPGAGPPPGRVPPPLPQPAPSAPSVAAPAERQPGTLSSAGVVLTRSIPAGPTAPGSAPRVPAAPPSKPAVSRAPAALPPQTTAPPRVTLHSATPPRTAPARAATAAPPPAPQPKNVGDLSGDRFGEIFSKYVETRQKHNEPTHAITRDALAKQLAESTQRLKQKHGGKAIDFEVVVKDGKTILRPVVK